MDPNRIYFYKIFQFIGLRKCDINKRLGHRRAENCFYVIPHYEYDTWIYGCHLFKICSEQTYNELIYHFHINEMEGFLEYSKLINNG